MVNYLDPSSEAHITKVVESELIGKQVSVTACKLIASAAFIKPFLFGRGCKVISDGRLELQHVYLECCFLATAIEMHLQQVIDNKLFSADAGACRDGKLRLGGAARAGPV